MVHDERVQAVVSRAYELSDQELEGIEEAARDLAALCEGDISVIDGARRVIHADIAQSPTRQNKQAASLIRRALEIGHWDWEAYESGAEPERGPQGPVLAAVAIGGAVGAPARYGVAQLIHSAPGSFPWSTFVVNVSGSFALGVVLAVLVDRLPAARHVRALLATGFLGAYTTYSTFAVDTDLLVKDGHVGVAAVYVVASLVVGLAAAWLGLSATRAALARQS